MSVVETSDLEAIKAIIESNPKVVLDLGAESWCVPCRRLRPHYDAAADKVDRGTVLIRADIDENPDLAKEYEVLSVPTVLAFKAGDPVGYVQSRTAVALIKEINEL